MISILIPFRENKRAFRHCIDALVSHCSRKKIIEIIVKTDDDTKDDIYAKEVLSENHVAYKVIKTSRGNGYVDMHKFWDELVMSSKGNILVPMGCDVIIIDGDICSIEEIKDDICLIYGKHFNSPQSRKQDSYRTFGHGMPMFSRKLYNLLGGLSQYDIPFDMLARGLSTQMRNHVYKANITTVEQYPALSKLPKPKKKRASKRYCAEILKKIGIENYTQLADR